MPRTPQLRRLRLLHLEDSELDHQLVLAHLRSLGHERIAHIAGPGSSSTGLARKKAFIELARAKAAG